MNTLYQLTLKQVASSTLPVSPLPEDVAQDVMRIRFGKVMEQIEEVFSDVDMEEYEAYEHPRWGQDRESIYEGPAFRHLQNQLFHHGLKSMARAYIDGMVEVTGLVWEVLGFKNRGDEVYGDERTAILRSLTFRRCSEVMIKLKEKEMKKVYEDYIEEEQGMFIIPMC